MIKVTTSIKLKLCLESRYLRELIKATSKALKVISKIARALQT